MVFSDFRHGIFNRDTIPPLTKAIPPGAFRVADSQVASRWGNILEFHGFDLITPNEREARFALGDQDSVVRPLGLELYRQAGCKTLILKLGERGLMTFRVGAAERSRTCAPSSRSTASPIGWSTRSARAMRCSPMRRSSLFATGSPVIASVLGSLAAAVECEHEGNVPGQPEGRASTSSSASSGSPTYR